MPADQRIDVQHLEDNFHSVVVHYGFMGAAQYSAGPRYLYRAAAELQNDGHFIFRRPVFDRAGKPVEMTLDQGEAVRPHASQRARRDRILLDSAEPRDRARRSDRDLSEVRTRRPFNDISTPTVRLSLYSCYQSNGRLAPKADLRAKVSSPEAVCDIPALLGNAAKTLGVQLY
jgi:hypothetical protein